MNRTARDTSADHPRPVKRIELNEDKLHVRFILVALLLAFGVGMMALGLYRLLTAESGWQTVDISTGEMNCSGDFVFYYELGRAGESPTAERKRLHIVYTQAAVDAYRIFSPREEFEGVGNLAALNARPNEPVTLEPALYAALEEIAGAGSRLLYLGPVYEMYESLFQCQDLSETASFDPWRNGDLRDWCARAAAFASDPASADVELLGNGRARLRLSEEYKAFLEESGTGTALDLFWMKNAFIADFLADTLISEGFTRGYLVSRDGFTRNLDDRGGSFGVTVYDRTGAEVIPAAVLTYEGPMSLAALHDYPVSRERAGWYYEMPGAEFRHPYVDAADGLCRAAVHDLLGYSRTAGCGELALALAGVYIADGLDTAALSALRDNGIDTVRCEAGTVRPSAPDAVFEALYAGDAVTYRVG